MTKQGCMKERVQFHCHVFSQGVPTYYLSPNRVDMLDMKERVQFHCHIIAKCVPTYYLSPNVSAGLPLLDDRSGSDYAAVCLFKGIPSCYISANQPASLNFFIQEADLILLPCFFSVCPYLLPITQRICRPALI
jgi:hypothetical protein